MQVKGANQLKKKEYLEVNKQCWKIRAPNKMEMDIVV